MKNQQERSSARNGYSAVTTTTQRFFTSAEDKPGPAEFIDRSYSREQSKMKEKKTVWHWARNRFLRDENDGIDHLL